MVEKSPLPRYLQRGLEAAERASIDLDAAWPARSHEPGAVDTSAAHRPRQSPPSPFPEGRHPIGDGGAIFKEIAAEWTGDVIHRRSDVARFFRLPY